METLRFLEQDQSALLHQIEAMELSVCHHKQLHWSRFVGGGSPT